MQAGEYWRNEGTQKRFTHPICLEWLHGLGRDAAILDVGCGYGRLTPILRKAGYSEIVGYDTSRPLLQRAVQENPGALYTGNIDTIWGRTFDLILCFALFTSCPANDAQADLISLIDRYSRQNTLLYISDYETGDNPSYRERYEQRQLGIHGCFVSGTGMFRHHPSGHFDTLLYRWKKCRESVFPSRTMNGNDIVVRQYLYVKE